MSAVVGWLVLTAWVCLGIYIGVTNKYPWER